MPKKQSTTMTSLATLGWVLSFCGWGIILGGLAAMQQQCGAASANAVMGTAVYMAPVTCDRFFSFDWFIFGMVFFTWLLVGVFIFSGRLYKYRSALVGLLAITFVLLCFMANTWYRAWGGLASGPTLTDTFKKRAKATFAGALISAVAVGMTLLIVGFHEEEGPGEQRFKGREPTTTVPVAVTTGERPGPIHGGTTGVATAV